MKITIHKNGVDYPVEAPDMASAMAAADALEQGNIKNRTTGERVGRDVKATATGVRQFGESMAGLTGDLPGMAEGATEYVGHKLQQVPFVKRAITEEGVQGAGEIAKNAAMNFNPLARIAQVLKAAGIIGDTGASVINPTSADVHGAVSSVLDKGGRIGERLNEATSYQPTNMEEKGFNFAGNFIPGMATGTSEISMAENVPAMVKALTTRFGARVAAPTAALTGTEAATDKAVKAGFITPEDATAIKTVVTSLSAFPAGALERSSAVKAAAGQVTKNPQALKVVYESLRNDMLDHPAAIAKLKELGVDDAMLVDLGANTKQLGIVASSAPGPGQEEMHARLKERQAQEGARLKDIKETAMGPGADRNVVAEEIKKGPGGTQEIGKQYGPTYSQQHAPGDTQHLVDDINTELGSVKGGDIRSTLNEIKNTLYIQDQYGKATPNLDPSSKGLHNARKALDAMERNADGSLKTNLSPEQKGTIEHYRNLINDEINRVNPAMKAVDEAFQAKAGEAKAFTMGEDALKKRGTETMTYPEFKTAWDKLTPEQQGRALEGASRYVEITMGLSPTERTTLKAMLGGDLNEAKLAEMIGQEKTAAFYKGLENQDVFHDTYQKIVKGTKATEQLKAEPGVGQGAVDTGLSAAIYSGDIGVGVGAGLTKAAVNLLRNTLAKESAQKANAKLKSDVASLLANPNPESVLKAAAKVQQISGKSALPSAMLNALVARRAGGPR